MLQLSNKLREFLSPADTGGSGSGTKVLTDMGKEDVIQFLGEEDETETIPLTEKKGKSQTEKETPSKEKQKETPEEDVETEEEDTEEEETDEDEDELAELEAELEGPSDEQLELKTPVPRSVILKKYPQLFKDFPYLETAYYREQQYTQLLPTIDDAKKAVEKSETLDKFERELMGGSTENVLKAVLTENKNAFYRIVDEYLPTLSRVDEKAYNHVLATVIKHTIESMVMEGRKSDAKKPLLTAAQLLNEFVFGTEEYTPPGRLSKGRTTESDQEENENTRQQREFTKQRFETTRGDLNTKVSGMLKATIDANIDPKNSMTDYVKRTASREALETLTGLIEKDGRFKTLMDRLWEKAFESNFDSESTDRIRKAYISKAKTLLPSVIKKARNEALRGLGKRVKDEENEETSQEETPPRKTGESRTPKKTGKITKASDIPKGMTTLEFLNSD